LAALYHDAAEELSAACAIVRAPEKNSKIEKVLRSEDLESVLLEELEKATGGQGKTIIAFCRA
jgi:hypothetical protein